MKHSCAVTAKSLADLTLNLIIICAEACSLIGVFARYGVKSFVYYTNLSNFLAFIASSVCSVCLVKMLFFGGKLPSFAVRLKFFAVTSLAVTVGVVAFALLPVLLYSSGGITNGSVKITVSSIFLHFVCPLLAFVSFVAFERTKLSFSLVVFAALPTLFYGLVMLFLNFSGIIVGPYPFFEVRSHKILAAVCCPLIPLAALLFAFLLSLVKFPKTKKVPE
mgnify:CR=1 FL=1